MDKKLYTALYDTESLDAFSNTDRDIFRAPRKGKFGDSAGTILGRHLEAIDPTIFEKQYPELALLTAGFEIDNTGGVAEFITSLRVDTAGEFKEAGDKDKNKGKITLRGGQSQMPVYHYYSNSDWDDTQVARLDQQGINLVNRLIAGHDQLYKRKIDEIGLVGITERSGLGLLNNTGFASSAAAGTVDTLTALQRYNAIADLINAQHSSVNNTPAYKANRVIMPARVMNFLNVQYTGLTTPMTVLKVLQETFPTVEFVETVRADTTENGGDLATSAVVAVSTNREVGVVRIPQPLTIGEIYRLGSFHHAVDSQFRIGGYDLLEGAGGRRLTGL